MEEKKRREEKKRIKVPEVDSETLEDHISRSIIEILQEFTYYSISKHSSPDDTKHISKNTIKAHLEQGKIPPDSFDSYIRAFGQIKRFDKTILEVNEKFNVENMEELIKIYYDIFETLNNFYKAFKKLPHDLISDKIKNKESAKELSQRFWYLLNKCFEAFCTLGRSDVLFLNKFFKSDENARQVIMTKMNNAKAVSYFDAIDILLNGEGNLWIDAYKDYSSNTEKKSSDEQNWEILTDKLQKFVYPKEINKKSNNIIDHALAINEFFAVIWPEEGETDTKFGSKEIEALIVFKYFLTQEAQQKLLNELQIEYPGLAE